MWTYSQVEGALARIYGVADEQKKAFRGRIQHFQRLGVPIDLRPGKGRKILYEDDHIFQWSLCLELSQFGVAPSVIAKTLQKHWASDLLKHFRSAYARIDRDVVITFKPRLLTASTSDGDLGAPKSLKVDQASLWASRLNKGELAVSVSEIVKQLRIARVLHDSAAAAERKQ